MVSKKTTARAAASADAAPTRSAPRTTRLSPTPEIAQHVENIWQAAVLSEDPFQTGSYLMSFDNGADEGSVVQALLQRSGLKTMVSSDFSSFSTFSTANLREDEARYFSSLGVAVIPNGERASSMSVSALSGSQIEPERLSFAIGLAMEDARYVQGYRDGISDLLARFDDLTEQSARPVPQATNMFADDDQYTWGLRAIGVPGTRYNGEGIRVAVLDTGIALNHPDWDGRNIVTNSFVPGEAIDDLQGHGTHVCGTIIGPVNPHAGPRYGVAPGVDLFVGKVLNNAGSGRDQYILAGLEWAVQQQCDIISMSLGAPPAPTGFSPTYERIARRLLRRGILMIAAAGNESHRPQRVAAVGSPANCPSIMSVAALDSNLSVSFFSNGGTNAAAIDIAAPGSGIVSAAPPPRMYRQLDGTSMATPHISASAALWAQSDPTLRGEVLWRKLLASARGLRLPEGDVGAGLAQVPT